MRQSVFNITENSTQWYLDNSLDDGEYVSKSLVQLPICHFHKKLNCTTLLDKFCMPFHCYDDIILQFQDDSVISVDRSVRNSNFTIVNITDDDDSDKPTGEIKSSSRGEIDEVLMLLNFGSVGRLMMEVWIVASISLIYIV